MVGQVLFGINNIYSVLTDGRQLQCRIKGKILKLDEKVYNPIAVGDFVELKPDPITDGTGWIHQRRARKSSLIRWNKKRKAAQVITANADLLLCIASADAPPFRPRFIDRLLISAEAGNMEPVIVLNKCDLGLDRSTDERLEVYSTLGYRVVRCSALTGEGIPELRKAIADRLAVFAGQSGAGKSSLLNCLDPDLRLKVREISRKHNRGVHTTSYSVMLKLKNGLTLIDTPGIREFELVGIKPEELYHYFRDLARYAPQCAYYACLHIDEPGCAVRNALAEGKIHTDRYESYLRLYDNLRDLQKEYYGSAYS
ncbi:Small ribosomal subunit biogenesis GTPase RsgA [subsurface metagenome]